MHRLAAIAIVTLFVASAVPARAQTTVAQPGYEAARAGLRVGYGGQGLDLDASVDSRRFGLVRFRADVGHGHWLGINSEGNDPKAVTRVAASALFYFAPAHHGIPGRPDFPAYVGVGIGAFVPHGDGFPTRMGARLIGGMEGSGDRWTVGLEGEIDLTPGKALDRFPRNDLKPTMRVGIAIRRHF